MREHPRLRLLQYITEWLGVLTLMVLIVTFSLTGWLLPPVQEAIPTVAGMYSEDLLRVRPLLLAIFLLAMAADGITLMLARVPGMFRYPVEVTGTNVEAQYVLGKIALNVTALGSNVYASAASALLYAGLIPLTMWTLLRLVLILGSFYVITWGIYYLISKRYT